MRRAALMLLGLALASPATPQGVVSFDRLQLANLTFMSAGEPVLVIHADGRITASKKAKPDDAARAILKSLETMLKNRECKR